MLLENEKKNPIHVDYYQALHYGVMCINYNLF